MRKTATKAVKVQPGDEVIVRAALPRDLKLARLYVWAKELGCDGFSPYVQNTDSIALDGTPPLLTPMSMRLVPQRPAHEISFVADMAGQIVIVQEVDTREDKLADVKLERYIATVSRLGRFKRRLMEWPRTVTL